MDQLSLNWMDRDISHISHGALGGSATPRRFLDFEVNGVSLYTKLAALKLDFISCLGWVGDEFDARSRSTLLIETEGEMRHGRVALYVCPECVDPLCGSITVAITQSPETIEWSSFAYDSGWVGEPDMDVFEEVDGLGPYTFKKSDYRRLLLQTI